MARIHSVFLQVVFFSLCDFRISLVDSHDIDLKDSNVSAANVQVVLVF